MNGPADPDAITICVVGSGTRFISGVSYYTYYLARALAQRNSVVTILMRRLVPRALYPGRRRVGAPISEIDAAHVGPTFDGVDWYLVPSMVQSLRFLRRYQPDVLILQWWTGAVSVPYILLTRAARTLGTQVIIEFHEDQDTGEAALPLVARAVAPILRWLITHADAYIVHSEWDRSRLSEKFELHNDQVHVIPLGPFHMTTDTEGAPSNSHEQAQDAATSRRSAETTILFFGVIRPYKGLEDLIDAFSLLPRDDGTPWRLLVVGETWEGWTLPAEKIALSPFRDDITFVNRYVLDSELPDIFDQADLVVLPYRRSSASGPLHLAMNRGLPVVTTDVGGLPEAVHDYSGAVLVPAEDPTQLALGIERARTLTGSTHVDVHDWDHTTAAYEDLFRSLLTGAK